MDKALEEYFRNHDINYRIHEHPAVFTVEESNKIIKDKSYLHTKNLFLKDEKGKLFLVIMPAEKKLLIKELQFKLNTRKLHFSNPDELKSELNVSPGSVSIFCMIYSKSTELILDEDVWNAESVGFHPNINTATLELNHENFKKFFDSINNRKKIIKI